MSYILSSCPRVGRPTDIYQSMLVAKESSSARDVDRQKLRHEQVKSDNNFHYFPKVDYRRIRWLRGMVDGEELGLKH